MSKHLLLQIATPEAILRLKHSDLADIKGEVEQVYFQQQCHRSVEAFFNRYMNKSYCNTGALMQVTINIAHLHGCWSTARGPCPYCEAVAIKVSTDIV